MKKMSILVAAFALSISYSIPSFADEGLNAPAVAESTVSIGMPQTTLPADPDVIPSVSNEDFISGAVKSVGTLLTEVGTKEGWAKWMAIALVALQLFFRLLGTPMFGTVWNRLAPNGRFIVVAVTSLAIFILTQMQLGIGFGSAAFSSLALVAVVDYVRKYYERFIEKKA